MSLYQKILSAIPNRITRGQGAASDYVTWTAFSEDGFEAGKWKYEYCYSPIMNHLGNYTIHCKPYQPRAGTSRMHPIHVMWFMRRCQNVGLIPQEIRIFLEPGVGTCMLIPREGWDRHTVYTALSLYRHCDCQAASMMTALRIHKQLGLPWLQVLHYTLAHLNHGTNHTFVGMDTYSGMGKINPGTGMALRAFASLTTEERKGLPQPGNTCNMFTALADVANPQRKYMYQTTEDILDPRYSPIYSDDRLGPEDLKRIMER